VIELSLAAMIRSTLLKMHKFEEVEFNWPCHGKEGRKEGIKFSGGGSKTFAQGKFTQLDGMSEHKHNYYCLEDSFTDARRRRS
jgi:hypothetical protein